MRYINRYGLRQAIFPAALPIGMVMWGLFGIGTLNGYQFVGSPSVISSNTESVNQDVANLIQKYQHLKGLIQQPETRPRALAELKRMAKPDVVRALAESRLVLEAGNPQDRSKATSTLEVINALEELGVPAAPALIKATRQRILPYRCSVFKYVSRLASHLKDHPEHWRALLPVIEDSDPMIRHWALDQGLNLMAAEPQVQELWFEIGMNVGRDLVTRSRAINALRGATKLSDKQIQALMPFLDLTEDPAERALRWSVQAVFDQHHEDAVPFLAKGLNSSKPERVLGVLACLERMGPNASRTRKKVRHLLQAEDREIRIVAAGCFWKVAQRPGPVVTLLESELAGEPDDRLFALCEAMGPRASAVADQVAEQIKRTREDNTFNRRTLTALSGMGKAALPHLHLLDACLHDGPNAWVAEVAVARTKIASNPGPAARCLANRIEREMARESWQVDPDRTEVNRLLSGLRRMGPYAAEVSPLVERLVGEWGNSTWIPIGVLKSMGPEALPALKRLAHDEALSEVIRRKAESAYQSLRQKQLASVGN